MNKNGGDVKYLFEKEFNVKLIDTGSVESLISVKIILRIIG